LPHHFLHGPSTAQVGKGRDVGLQQLFKFEAKLAQGALISFDCSLPSHRVLFCKARLRNRCPATFTAWPIRSTSSASFHSSTVSRSGLWYRFSDKFSSCSWAGLLHIQFVNSV